MKIAVTQLWADKKDKGTLLASFHAQHFTTHKMNCTPICGSYFGPDVCCFYTSIMKQDGNSLWFRREPEWRVLASLTRFVCFLLALISLARLQVVSDFVQRWESWENTRVARDIEDTRRVRCSLFLMCPSSLARHLHFDRSLVFSPKSEAIRSLNRQSKCVPKSYILSEKGKAHRKR